MGRNCHAVQPKILLVEACVEEEEERSLETRPEGIYQRGGGGANYWLRLLPTNVTLAEYTGALTGFRPDYTNIHTERGEDNGKPCHGWIATSVVRNKS